MGLEKARHGTHLRKDEPSEDEPSLSSSKLLRSRGGVLPAVGDGVEVRVVDGSETWITGLLEGDDAADLAGDVVASIVLSSPPPSLSFGRAVLSPPRGEPFFSTTLMVKLLAGKTSGIPAVNMRERTIDSSSSVIGTSTAEGLERSTLRFNFFIFALELSRLECSN